MIENTDYILKQIKKPNKGGLDYISEYFCKPKKENVVKLKKNIDKLFLDNGYAILYNNEIIINNNNDLEEENKNKKTHDKSNKFIGSGLSVLAVKNEIMKGNFIFNCGICKQDMVYTEYNGKKSFNFSVKEDLSVYIGYCNRCESKRISEYHKENKEQIREKQREYLKNRIKTDPLFKLKCNLRTRTYTAFKSKGYSKNTKTQKILGVDWEVCKEHIEKQFTKGMSWDNFGDWHIDHIIPLASANTGEELKLLCHHQNLQPLWAADNLIKKDKYRKKDKAEMLNLIKNYNKYK